MTLRLLDIAESHWDTFDGWCVSNRVEPWELPSDRFLSLVYYWSTRYADEKEKRKFDTRLWIPPPGYTEPITEGPWTAEAEMSGFRGLATSLNIDTKPAVP